MQDPGKVSTLEQLENFLRNTFIKYTLQLSLLDRPWLFIMSDYAWKLDAVIFDENYFFSERDKQRTEYQAQLNNEEFTSTILQTLFRAPVVNLLTELRLELRMSTDKDAQLILEIFTRGICLQRLALDLTSRRSNAIRSLPLDTFLPPGLQTTYRIVRNPKVPFSLLP